MFRTTIGLAAAVTLVACSAARGQDADVRPATGAPIESTAPIAASPASREPGRPGSFGVVLSGLWTSSASLGARDASLIANDSGGSSYRLFSASGTLGHAAGLDARASWQATRAIAVEAGMTWSRPAVSFTVANDAEGAAGFTAQGETVSEVYVEASVLVFPMPKGVAGGRARPFVEAGAGYLRELHGQSSALAGYAEAESGQVFHGGGGLDYYFHPRPSGLVRAFGLRAAARVYARHGGFTFDRSTPVSFAAGAGLLVAF